MTRSEFKKHIEKTLYELKLYAELHYGQKLPNDFEFEWCLVEKTKAIGKNDIIELIADKVYLNEKEIYPCVDLVTEKITLDNRIYISGRISGHKPREFGKGWSNRPGPFIYGIGPGFINKKIKTDSKEFKELLFKKGLIHYN
ncbi:hypothetical protein [uncultured Aquimarina sp.]|uniref:hypothetical protein n=1 Tax=uncultured Aquimarina sp. TaxID=575652 RepID=UPI0026173D4F|nr:hypothetical protein [uncultured Aquimarina sp.]